MSTKRHYEEHLSHFYEWMLGDFEEAASRQQTFFQENNIISKEKEIAFDLGAGNGLQSIPLAKLGHEVYAFDFNQRLLDSLNERKRNLAITTVLSDLESFHTYQKEPSLIVCMGDTLTHLDSIAQVSQFLSDCYSKIKPGGSLVLSFRDYGTTLTGEKRFLPVKADENRIHTCVLDYDEEKVLVTDLIHERVNGAWSQRVSAYYKTRLTVDTVVKKLKVLGFLVKRPYQERGMYYIIAEKNK